MNNKNEVIPVPSFMSDFKTVVLITGTVYKDEDSDGMYDARTDIPIPGAIVSTWLDNELVAINDTDEKGEYAISATPGKCYTLRGSLPSEEECYDPETKRWGFWSTIKGESKCVVISDADNQDISINYRMLNYGPRDFRWQLWHRGPIFPKQNVVLVHGFSEIPRVYQKRQMR